MIFLVTYGPKMVSNISSEGYWILSHAHILYSLMTLVLTHNWSKMIPMARFDAGLSTLQRSIRSYFSTGFLRSLCTGCYTLRSYATAHQNGCLLTDESWRRRLNLPCTLVESYTGSKEWLRLTTSSPTSRTFARWSIWLRDQERRSTCRAMLYFHQI